MLQGRPNGRRRKLRISGRASGGKSRDVELTKNAPRFLSGVRRCEKRNESAANAQNQLDRSLSCGRGARLKCKAPSRFGAAARVIERMLDPLETNRHRKRRRRRRERVRYQKDRGADRAVIVIVAGISRRSLWRGLRERRAMRRDYWPVRATGCTAKMKIVQMDVAEGERDLQRQRRQRQQRTAPLMAMNEVHLIPTSPTARMLTLQCNNKQETMCRDNNVGGGSRR